MNARINELHLQRGRLLERIAAQRGALVHDFQPVRSVLSATDRILVRLHAAVDCVKQYPSLAALAVTTLFIIKPGRVWRWTKRGFFFWRTWRILSEKLFPAGLRVRP